MERKAGGKTLDDGQPSYHESLSRAIGKFAAHGITNPVFVASPSCSDAEYYGQLSRAVSRFAGSRQKYAATLDENSEIPEGEITQ